jgi:hypothetical protein
MAAPLSCDSCEEMLADYLLHALELEVVQAVTEHLSTCVRCRAQLTASEAVLAHLAHGVPQRAPRGTRLAPAGRGRQRGSVHGLRSGAPAPTPTDALAAANAVLCLGMGWWPWHVQREAALVHQRWQEVQHLPAAAQAKPYRR